MWQGQARIQLQTWWWMLLEGGLSVHLNHSDRHWLLLPRPLCAWKRGRATVLGSCCWILDGRMRLLFDYAGSAGRGACPRLSQCPPHMPMLTPTPYITPVVQVT